MLSYRFHLCPIFAKVPKGKVGRGGGSGDADSSAKDCTISGLPPGQGSALQRWLAQAWMNAAFSL